MTEYELIENKVRSRLHQMHEHQFAARAPIGPWRTKAADRYLDGGVPTPDETWKTIAPGEAWRPESEATWFVATAAVPEDWGGAPVIARIDISGESQAFVDGRLVQSINHNGHNPGRDEILLSQHGCPGERFTLALEAAPWWIDYHGPHLETFKYADLIVVNEAVRDFLRWAHLTLDAALTWPDGSTERRRMVRLLDEVLRGLELRLAGTLEFTRRAADGAGRIRQGLKEIGPGGPGAMTLVGHAHIDTAWLWPLSETHRKCGRTFSNMLCLMERYPEFRFCQSQPQLYQFAKQFFPEIYQGIRERVAAGQWELVGGAWVECDCNIPGGEALVRQLLYGKRFFRQEFGRDTIVGWWPDAFGYTWSLPQILAHCGIRHFYSTKISWNQYDTFPCGLFWWQGIDGTRLLSFHATGTYNGQVTPAELAQLWREFPERDRVDDFLSSFGYGDGGGGPTSETIERCRRLDDMPGIPRCRMGRADEFFAAARRQAEGLPTWNDELYLELHRGCQTTQARTKRGNRKLELALRDAEILSSLAMVREGINYPSEAFGRMWENLLCYQFHDILPGSSVRQVYAEAEEDYASMLARVHSLRDTMIAAAADHIDTRGDGQPVLVFNTLSWERTDPAEVTLELCGDDFEAVSPSGERTPCQVVARDGDSVTILFLARVPAMGYATYHIDRAAGAPVSALYASPSVLENDHVRAEIDADGRLARLYDKQAHREVLPTGRQGNLLQLFEDRPADYDAWDIDPWFEDQMREFPAAESVELLEAGPVRAALRLRRRTEHSTLVQELRLYAHSPRLEFVTHVDWHERKTLLKVAFPVDVLASQATYEIQFGAIQRPTHDNTSWDRAKVEVAAHRWIDLSEAGYGVALLNDCKYGHDVKGNVLRTSLLRSPVDPDTEADQGEHDFIYALQPHQGSWQESGLVRRGLELNVPVTAVAASAHEGAMPASGSAISCRQAHVVVETLKKSEDGGDLILRVYEAHGARGPVEIGLRLPVQAVVECNGLEEEIGPADWRDGRLRFDMRPWQIRTFRLRS